MQSPDMPTGGEGGQGGVHEETSQFLIRSITLNGLVSFKKNLVFSNI